MDNTTQQSIESAKNTINSGIKKERDVTFSLKMLLLFINSALILANIIGILYVLTGFCLERKGFFIVPLLTAVFFLLSNFNKNIRKKIIHHTFELFIFFFALLLILLIPEKLSIICHSPFLNLEIFIIITFLVYLILLWLFKIRQGIIIEDFKDFTGVKNGETKETPVRGIDKFLIYELDRLLKLYNEVNYRRIPHKQLMSNYPESAPPSFHSKDTLSDFDFIQSGVLKIMGLAIQFSPLLLINKLVGGHRIIGTVSIIDGKRVITAELTGKPRSILSSNRNYKSSIKKFLVQIDLNETEKTDDTIWRVNSHDNFHRDAPKPVVTSFQMQLEQLARQIFSSIFISHFGYRQEAIMHFNMGLYTYSQALHQPFLRRQLLTEAADSFRKAIEEDDDFYQAMHNLGIVFLDLSMRDRAKQMFNKAIEKMPSYNPSRYALAEMLFEPIKKDFASIVNKFLGPEHEFPFASLKTKNVYRKSDGAKKEEYINRCHLILQLCNSITDTTDIKDEIWLDAQNLLCTVYMYLEGKDDDENLFLKNCQRAVLEGEKIYHDYKSKGKEDTFKNKFVNSLLNFATACMRRAQREACREANKSSHEYKRLIESKNNLLDAAIAATEWAKLITQEGDADVYYVEGLVYFSFGKNESVEAFHSASKLYPDNLNYKALYAAALIKSGRNDAISTDILHSLKATLFACPSRIRHETIELLSKIELKKLYPLPKVYKTGLEIISGAIFLTCIGHHYDRSPVVKSLFVENDDVYNEFKKLFKKNCNRENLGIKIKRIREMTDSECDILKLWSTHTNINFNLRDFRESIKSLREHWMSGQLFAMAGREFLLHSKYQNAEYCFQEAIRVFSNGHFEEEIRWQRINAFYGFTLSRKIDYVHLPGKNLNKAKSIINSAQELLAAALSDDPLDPMAFFANALIYFKMGNFLMSRDSFIKSLSLSHEPWWIPQQICHESEFYSQPVENYLYLGISSVMVAQTKELKKDRVECLYDAIHAFSCALDIINASSRSDRMRPIEYWNQLTEDIKAKSNYWMGKTYFLLGKWGQAIENLELVNIYSKDKVSGLAEFYCARSYHRLREIGTAIEKYTKLIQIPANIWMDESRWFEDYTYCESEIIPLSYLFRADCYAGIAEHERARKDLCNAKKSIERTGCSLQLKAYVQITEGILEYHKNNFIGAIRTLRQAFSHSTDYELLEHLQLAIINNLLDTKDETKTKFDIAQLSVLLKLAEHNNLTERDEFLLGIRLECLKELMESGKQKAS